MHWPIALRLSVQSAVIGTVIILFFRCVSALVNPINPCTGVEASSGHLWPTPLPCSRLSLDRFGTNTLSTPSGYSLVPRVMFMLNNWLVDGLLVSSVGYTPPPLVYLASHNVFLTLTMRDSSYITGSFEMPRVLWPNLVDCTVPSSAWLPSLPPFTPSVLYCSLEQMVPEAPSSLPFFPILVRI